METIKKKISIDKSRSHKGGFLPFIQCETGEYIYEDITSGNSNYGHYVCDLGIKITGETKGSITYDNLLKIDSTTLEKGDKYIVSNSHGSISAFTYTPENTIYKWDGNQWIFYEDTIKYLDIINRYNEIREILLNATFCKCVNSKKGKILKKCQNALNNINNCDTITCGDNLYDYIPLNLGECTKLSDNFYYFNNIEELVINNHYILIGEYNKYIANELWAQNLGLSLGTNSSGFTFKHYVDSNLLNSSGALNTFFLVPPVVEIPILLEQESLYNTLYYPYEYTLNGVENTEVIINGEVHNAKVGTNVVLYSDMIDSETNVGTINVLEDSIMCESRLSKLKHYNAIDIAENFCGIMSGWTKVISAKTENNVVFYETINSGKMFKCKHYSETLGFNDANEVIYPNLKNENVYQVIITNTSDNNISWWECIPIDDSNGIFECKDGQYTIGPESSDNEVEVIHFYRNLVTLGCISHFLPEPVSSNEEDNIYYFKATYQNGKINPLFGGTIDTYTDIIKLSYPFIIGEPVNVEVYDNNTIVYDMVLSAETIYKGSAIYNNISYVLGATSGVPNTGIFYREVLEYTSGVTDNVLIDNIYDTSLWYEKLNFDTNVKSYYNEIYNTEFEIREAEIYKMELNSEININYPLITKEGNEILYNEPSLETNIILDRGIAAACEKHFKLSECNTFQDLKNYGNNIFNL